MSELNQQRFRVEVQHEWPKIFSGLTAAIGFLKQRHPLWWVLEREVEPGVWETVTDVHESRLSRHNHEYEEDKG